MRSRVRTGMLGEEWWRSGTERRRGSKKMFLFFAIALFGACAFETDDGQKTGLPEGKEQVITIEAEYRGEHVVLRWKPAVPIKIKMKYEEGTKSDWFYLRVPKKLSERKDEIGETSVTYGTQDVFDTGELPVPVLPDNIVSFQGETQDGKLTNVLTVKTISTPSIYISSYDDLRFRLEVSVPPYARKIIVERRKGDGSTWEQIKEISVDDDVLERGNVQFEDKVSSEGVWFYRARAENEFGGSGYSREFFASPVICEARRAPRRLKGKQAGCGWAYRRTITVTNSSPPDSDVVIRVVLNTAALISAGKMKPDCSDVRFTDQTDEIFLPYWIGVDRLGQTTCNTSQTVFWVKIPYLVSGTNLIYMYYGNEVADAVSDPHKVFVYFENFESYSVGERPPSGWVHYGSGILQIGNDAGNKVIIKGCFNTASGCSPTGGAGDPSGGYVLFPYPISNFIAIFRVKRVDISSGAAADRRDSVGLEDLNQDGYSAFENTVSDLFGITRRDGGTTSTDLASSTASLPDTGSWNLFVFYKVGPALTLELTYSGGTLTVSASDSNHMVFERLAIRGGRDYYVDDIAVARYANVSVSVGAESSSSYTGLFLRRIPLVLNASQALKDFQVMFELPLADAVATDKIRNDCGDLRFSDSPYFEVDLWGLSFPYYFEARGPCGGDVTLRGWWEFDDGSGTSASDSSGDGNTATLSSSTLWGEGRYSGGVNLTPSSTTDYVSIPGGVLSGRSEVSISVWVRWTGSSGAAGAILSASGSGTDNEFLIYKIGVNLWVYVKGATFGFAGVGGTLETPGWHHIVLVRKVVGNDSRVFLYVNGTTVSPSTGGVIGGAGGNLNVNCIVIGQESDAADCSVASFDVGQDWEGYVDDLRIFSRELAPYEVRMLYQGRARVWVKIPHISLGIQTLYAYFGNPSKTSIASGERTFEFFEDFWGTSLNTARWWGNSANYTVSYGAIIRTGNFVSRYPIVHSNVGRAFEVLARWHNSNAPAYAGLNIADDDRTSSVNSQADCVAYWMSQSGDNPAGSKENFTIWGAEGDSASYDVANDVVLYTIDEWDWYIGGFRFTSSQFIYYIFNGLYAHLNTLTYTGQWRGGFVGTGDRTPEQEPGAPYVFLGDFQGLNAGVGGDIDDIEIKWFRVRKDGAMPAVSYGSVEDSTE